MDSGWLLRHLTAEKTAFVYDLSGKMVRQIPLPATIQSLSMAMLNEATNTFLLGDGKTAKLLLYEVGSTKTTAVAPLNGQIQPLVYKTGYFFTSNSTTGEVLRIDEKTGTATSPLCDREANLLTEDMTIGLTDTKFRISTPESDTTYYVCYNTVDEIPMDTTDGQLFVTVSCRAEEDILAVYDLHMQSVSRVSVPHAVEQVQFISGCELLAVTKDADRHHLYIRNFSEAETDELVILKSDRTDPGETPDTSEPEVDTPNGSHTLKVPLLSQWPEFPTGCESVSAVMALRYAGENITVTRFIDEYLPQSMHFYYENGVKYGPSPYEYFLGSPKTDAAYGCMSPVIEKALTAYFGTDERIVNTTGTSLDELCRTYIDKNIPVLVWATIAMIESYPTASWRLPDGTEFSWPANEHCLVLVGYDKQKYYFNDPYTGKLVGYSRSLSESRYKELGQQSLVITKQ